MNSYVIQGLCNQWEELTMIVAQGHDVPAEAFMAHAVDEEGFDAEMLKGLGDPQNRYGRWEPVTDPEGAWDPDTMRFVVCEKDHHHAKPYTVVRVEDI